MKIRQQFLEIKTKIEPKKSLHFDIYTKIILHFDMSKCKILKNLKNTEHRKTKCPTAKNNLKRVSNVKSRQKPSQTNI